MGTFRVTYDYEQLRKMKKQECRKCGIKFKDGDEGMRINGAHTKHYHRKCYEEIYHDRVF